MTEIMKRSAVLQIAVAVAACAWVHESAARADQVRHPAGFTFELPDIGTAWAQETRGEVLVVSDDTDKVPELELFVFPVRQEGPLGDIVTRLPAEVVRPGVALIAARVTAARLVGTVAREAIADATAITGELRLNDHDRAAFAIVQRGGRSAILLAVPDTGIYERGATKFRAVLHGLKASGGPAANRPAPPPAATPATRPAPAPTSGAAMPKFPGIVAIREVTATSTFADKKNLYAAWRTLNYDAIYDEATQTVAPTTAWCEGAPGEGIGQGVTIAFAAPTQVDAIHIAAGVWKTAKLFTTNNRIASLDLVVDGTPSTVTPAARRTWLDVPIGRSISTVTVKIAAVAKGKMNDSCISAIWFDRKDARLATVVGIDAAAVAALPRALVAIDGAFGTPALEHLLDYPFSFHPGLGRDTNEPRITYPSWKAIDAACRAQEKAQDSGSFRESKVTCPYGVYPDPNDTRDGSVGSPEPGMVELVFPGKHEYLDVWRLRWHDGGWHLAAIDYAR
jgi:hypothetical protein